MKQPSDRQNSTVRACAALAALLMLCDASVSPGSPPGDPNNSALIERIRKNWTVEGSVVKTAEVEVEFFQAFGDHIIPRERVERMLEECRKAWSATGESSEVRAKTQMLELPKATFAQAWKQGTIRVDAKKCATIFGRASRPEPASRSWMPASTARSTSIS